MKNQRLHEYQDYIGHHTIIFGDVNAKKTYHTEKFIQYLIEAHFNPNDITILDFAPRSKEINGLNVGGKLRNQCKSHESCNFVNLKGDIIPLRLTARNKKELHEIVEQNYIITSEALEAFNKNPTHILIINDISIYLHYGDKKKILQAIKKTTTFFGNSYYGKSIKNPSFYSLFNIKERKNVKYIIKHLERRIKL